MPTGNNSEDDELPESVNLNLDATDDADEKTFKARIAALGPFPADNKGA